MCGPNDPMDDNSPLIQVMSRPLTGAKPLPEPMLIKMQGPRMASIYNIAETTI